MPMSILVHAQFESGFIVSGNMFLSRSGNDAAGLKSSIYCTWLMVNYLKKPSKKQELLRRLYNFSPNVFKGIKTCLAVYS